MGLCPGLTPKITKPRPPADWVPAEYFQNTFIVLIFTWIPKKYLQYPRAEKYSNKSTQTWTEAVSLHGLVRKQMLLKLTFFGEFHSADVAFETSQVDAVWPHQMQFQLGVPPEPLRTHFATVRFPVAVHAVMPFGFPRRSERHATERTQLRLAMLITFVLAHFRLQAETPIANHANIVWQTPGVVLPTSFVTGHVFEFIRLAAECLMLHDWHLHSLLCVRLSCASRYPGVSNSAALHCEHGNGFRLAPTIFRLFTSPNSLVSDWRCAADGAASHDWAGASSNSAQNTGWSQ